MFYLLIYLFDMARISSFHCFTRRSGIIYSIFLCLLCYTKSKEYDKNGVFVFGIGFMKIKIIDCM